MDPNDTSVSDEQFDLMLAYVLRAGVLLSGAIVACGGLVFLFRHGFEQPAYHVFRGEPLPLRSIHGIVEAASVLSGRGLVQLGLLVLIATPISRALFSMVGFARQRDWLYVGIRAGILSHHEASVSDRLS